MGERRSESRRAVEPRRQRSARRHQSATVAYRKGIGSTFPNLARSRSRSLPFAGRGRLVRGDAHTPGDVVASPGKSSLFLLRGALHGIGSSGDMDVANTTPKAARLSRCPACSCRPVKILASVRRSRASPYPYPQQVSEVHSLWSTEQCR